MSSDRVLVLLKSYLGDAVMATPLLRALPSEDLAVRAPKVIHELLKNPSRPYQALVSDPFKGLSRLIQEARRLRQEDFRAAILVNRSFRTALMTRIARIPMRIGHATEGRSWLLTHTVPYDQAAPEAKSYADLVTPLGATVTDLTPDLWISEEERQRGKCLVEEGQVGIQPGARYPAKTIPHGVLVEVADKVQAEGLRPVLFGGIDEVAAGHGFSPTCLNLIGKLSLRESMGAAANMKAMIGSDTGFMHVAAAVHCPTVTVFGPTPSSKWGHATPPHQVLNAPSGDVSRIPAEEIWACLQRILS